MQKRDSWRRDGRDFLPDGGSTDISPCRLVEERIARGGCLGRSDEVVCFAQAKANPLKAEVHCQSLASPWRKAAAIFESRTAGL